MKKLSVFLIWIVIASLHGVVFAKGTIIEVSRNLQLNDKYPLPPKNYLLDVGKRDGIKAGDVVDVYRTVPAHNSLVNRPEHLMRVNLGEIKITHVSDAVSVGRMYSQIELQDLPMKGTSFFMIGDAIQRKSGLPFESRDTYNESKLYTHGQ